MSIKVGLVNSQTQKYSSPMPIEQAQLLSVEKAEKEAKKSPATKIQKALFPALVGSFVLASVAKTKGSPAKKLAVGTLGALSYFILDKSFDAAAKLTNNVVPEDKKDGMLPLLGSIAGGFGIYTAATSLINKGSLKLGEKFPKIGKTIKGLADKINSSKTIETVMNTAAKPFKAFAQKFPKATSFLSKNYFTMGVVGFLLANTALSLKIQNDKIKTYNESMQSLQADDRVEGVC